MTPALEARLRRGSEAVGVVLPVHTVSALGHYLELLLFWNRKVNLTAVREPSEVIDRHFVDALAVVPHVPASARTLVDVGSGGGFPGAVIALLRPELRVALVESIHKNASLLSTLRRELPLPGVSVHPTRVEDWARTTPERVDVAVSRAVWDLGEWLVRGAALVRPGGTILGMEGSERHPLPAGATRLPYPHPSGPRALIVHIPDATPAG
jgi:16S rRNA (guanine527-N7)-methyltransferase